MNAEVPQDYEEVLAFLFAQLPMFSTTGASALHPSLDRIELLCEAMQHPERNFKSVHIAGTNGKGSTSHILAACMQTAGYKTGLYTSPHLVDIRERIRIDGQLIPKEMVLQFVQRYWEAIHRIQPSYFELNVAMAFWAFSELKVDVAIIETGLGGTWDSTNIIIPELSVITNISLDHTHILGDTLAAIAGEKAGIIKEGVPVVIGQRHEETEPVFSKQAILKNAPIVYAASVVDGAIVAEGAQYQEMKLVTHKDAAIMNIKTDLLGAFQLHNIKTSIAAVAVLETLGWKVNAKVFREAVSRVKELTGLRGRWDIIRQQPLVIADVGHNPDGINQIMRQLQHEEYRERRKHVVVGFVADKDVEAALKQLPTDAEYYFTQAQVPRALAVHLLGDKANHLGLEGTEFATVAEAVAAALAACKASEMVLIMGSFFIVGEALAFLEP